MTKLKNVYFDVLRWRSERIDEGANLEELKAFLEERKGATLGDSRAEAIFRELFTPIEFGSPTQGKLNDAMRDGEKFHLKVESAFRYLEMQGLEEARQSSKSAMIVAIIAIFIGAVVGITQIWIALY